MWLVLALSRVLLLFGAGFAVHLLWIVAVVFAVLWFVGSSVGRREVAGRQHFQRWWAELNHPTLVSRAMGTRVAGRSYRVHA
jgi:hypothetical protein